MRVTRLPTAVGDLDREAGADRPEQRRVLRAGATRQGERGDDRDQQQAPHS
jgi:hypothetical protein